MTSITILLKNVKKIFIAKLMNEEYFQSHEIMSFLYKGSLKFWYEMVHVDFKSFGQDFG